jgi:Winged helix DNA-binding domain
VLRAIAGAQSQEPRAGRLQVRARSRRLTAADVERARVEERSIVRTWLMRMTVHLVPAEDHGWLAPLFAERILGWSRRRLATFGVSDSQRDRVLAAAARALKSGPLPRSELMELARQAGIEPTIQHRTHLAVQVVVGGAACIGPDAGRETVLVASGDWLGEQRRRDPDASMDELARRYFGAFAPASDRDFSYWSGLPLGQCRAAIARIGRELGELRCGEEILLAPRGYVARAPRSPSARLLPAFDTYLLGYRSRGFSVGEEGERRVIPGGGVLRPSISVDGRLVGTWSNRRSGRRLAIALEPFAPLSPEVLEALAVDAADIGRFEHVQAELAASADV